MSERRRLYTGTHVDVSFDGGRCRHAAECVRGLQAVFDTNRRLWILPDGASADSVVEIVARCPTGALRTHPHDVESERVPGSTTVKALPGGPLLLRGNLDINGERELRAALCSCGASANAPYCDGAGTCKAWPSSEQR